MDQPTPQPDPPPDAVAVADRPPAPPPPYHGESLRATVRLVLHTAALLVIIFLFVRVFALEPFGVPTGSMAPALLGNHRLAHCPRCGYPVVAGGAGADRASATCPNCGRRRIDLSAAREIPGDRLLVDKNVFNLRHPRRWEPAVFRCPVDSTKPYVKRVIGLPGEAVQLVGGDVFADGVLQRKALTQVRETRIPVFDLDYAPPGGWGVRFLIEPVTDDPRRPPTGEPPKPADGTVVQDGAIHLDATAADRPAIGLTYRNWFPDEKAEDAVRDALAYNDPLRLGRAQPVHDFVFACELEVLAGRGSFACRLGDGLDSVKAELPVGPGPPTGGVTLGRDGDDVTPGSSLRLEPGRTYAVEFAFVDRRASLAIDGAGVVPPLDLPGEPERLARRGAVSRPLQLGVRGASVVLRRVRLYRDIHYRADAGDDRPCRHAGSEPYRLGQDEYFMLGDNSANSHDSREWETPGVPERDFIGKPFLIHQPLTLGRVTVNGRERVYQTVDWSRLRWLR